MHPRPLLLGLIAATLLLPALTGCGGRERVKKPSIDSAMPTFTGPEYLHGTVGSIVRLNGGDPVLVQGYGVVVNLAGTGSPDVPAFLRQWLLQEMRKKGLGSAQLGTQAMTPERVLASPNTAVVLVQGLIPPGAVRGTRFDVLVSALPGTQTTSLEAGQLWSTELSLGGSDVSMAFRTTLASAAGPLYLDPFDDRADPAARLRLEREGVILSGGVATRDRVLELVLNEPSDARTRLVADRINERFPADPEADRQDTAVAKTDTLVRLHIPRRFARDPNRFLLLVNHLYLQRAPGFEPAQAQTLAQVLIDDHATDARVVPAWISLGKTALPTIRQYYTHPDTVVRMAALEAGVWLQDESTTSELIRLAKDHDPALRVRCAQLLAFLPRSIRGNDALRSLLDDHDPNVRVAAYDALASISHPILQRVPFGRRESFKFVLDLVPSTHPLLYIVHGDLPRIVVFNPDSGFNVPGLASLWDNRFMFRVDQPGQPASVFYQPYGSSEPRTFQIAPTLANLVFLLAHQTSVENPTDGLNLSYSQVAAVVHRLAADRIAHTPVVVRPSPLAQLISQAANSPADQRPEFAPEEPTPPNPDMSSPDSKPGASAPDSDLQPIPPANPDIMPLMP